MPFQSMAPFMEGSPGVDDPISADATEEAGKCQELRSDMVWLDQVWDVAKQEARRLREVFGGDNELTAEVLLNDPGEYHRLKKLLSPSHLGDALRYQLFAVIMHHGSAYSGHYSAYIRDCNREGTWTPPPPDRGEKKSGEVDGSLNSKICFVLKRPGELVVKEGSPLNVLLSIMNTTTEGDSNSSSTRRKPNTSTRGMQVGSILEYIYFPFFLAIYLMKTT
jgi:hypothetical protein